MTTPHHSRSQGGFTIIELITVVAITAIISVVAVSVLVNTQIRGTRATAISRVRQEGSFALDRMAFVIRNAQYIEQNFQSQECQNSMPALRVRTADGGSVEFFKDGARIASASGTVLSPPSAYLSSEDMIVESLYFFCEQQPGQKGAIVRITFTLATGIQYSIAPESFYEETFTTQVVLRSYQ